MKITEEILREIAEKYCRDNTPLSRLAIEYGVAKSSLVRYFNGERRIKLDPITQRRVNIVKKENWDKYKATSGNLNHRTLEDEYVVLLANRLIDNNLSLQELSDQECIPKSTLFSLFTESILGEELYIQIIQQYSKNKAKRGNK